MDLIAPPLVLFEQVYMWVILVMIQFKKVLLVYRLVRLENK